MNRKDGLKVLLLRNTKSNIKTWRKKSLKVIEYIEKHVKCQDVEQQQVQSEVFAAYEGEGKRKVKDPDVEERKVVVEQETSV